LDNSPIVHEFANVKVIHSPKNYGPWVNAHVNQNLYHSLPNNYVVTDPDLQLNLNLPPDFLDQLLKLSSLYKTYKIGMALDISEADFMYKYGNYAGEKSIVEHESQFWSSKLENTEYELYTAEIDTTFALYNKSVPNGPQIRVGGNFTARHLPWYVNNPVISKYQQLQQYATSKFSHISDFFNRMLTECHLMVVRKRQFQFIVQKDYNENFWMKHYPEWENESFDVYDAHLKPDGIMLDIGAWTGCTSLYARNLCRRIYAVEADKISVEKLHQNIQLNDAQHDIMVINKAIYAKSHAILKFGKNSYIPNSKLDDSTSQILCTTNTQDYDLVTTISPEDIVSYYIPNPEKLCLIKVDIEGGEEHVLNQLWQLKIKYNIPLYVSFHLDWWQNKDLNRFSFLTSDHRNRILQYKFCNILFP
jgi:FkbM family methyltransferase